MMNKDDRLDETRVLSERPALTAQQREDITPLIDAIAAAVVAHLTQFATITIPAGIPVTVTPETGIGETTAAATGTIA